MNSKIMIGIVVVIIISIVVLYLVFFKNNKIINNPKQLELTYEINAGIPFRWEVEVDDESIVKFVRKYVVRDDNKGGIVGASIYTNYVFEAVGEGETIIRFKCVNFADNYVSSEKEHKVKVDKGLRISLINNE